MQGQKVLSVCLLNIKFMMFKASFFSVHLHNSSSLCLSLVSVPLLLYFTLSLSVFVPSSFCLCKPLRTVEVKRKAVQRIEEQLMKLQVQATDREENKQIALGTSKLNYLDPRISVAWYLCDTSDVVYLCLLTSSYYLITGVTTVKKTNKKPPQTLNE